MELVKGRVVPAPGYGPARVNGDPFPPDELANSAFGRACWAGRVVSIGVRPATSATVDFAVLGFERSANATPPTAPVPEVMFDTRSPGDRTGELLQRIGKYLNAGVTVVVVLDPARECATVYRQTDDFPQRRHNGDELTLPDVLSGFAAPVRRFFEELRETGGLNGFAPRSARSGDREIVFVGGPERGRNSVDRLGMSGLVSNPPAEPLPPDRIDRELGRSLLPPVRARC
ncbi:Uma2 family endonuclease [bacterium]|nr:Uma2 family endonuclease [bacterium]